MAVVSMHKERKEYSMTEQESHAMAEAVQRLGLIPPIEPDEEDMLSVERYRVRNPSKKISDADAYRQAQARRMMRATVEYWSVIGGQEDLIEKIEDGLKNDDTWPGAWLN